jgi:hypothetical protein
MRTMPYAPHVARLQVAGGISKTLDTLQWGWDNTVLANISVAWVIINMVRARTCEELCRKS